MSCFVVSKHVIDTMVSAAAWWSELDDPMHWQAEGGPLRRIPGCPADEVGQMLWDANVDGFRRRYPNDDQPYLEYRFQLVTGVPPVPYVMQAIAVYEYQTGELMEDWRPSEAFSFCESLRLLASTKLDGYGLLYPEQGGGTSFMQWWSQMSSKTRAVR